MFNMEKSAAKEEKAVRQLIDLEQDMHDLTKAHEINANVQNKVQMLTSSLREGASKESFEKQQTLLAGYVALQKVLGRINRKMV